KIKEYAREWRDLQTKMAERTRRLDGMKLAAPAPAAPAGRGDGMPGLGAQLGMVGGVQLDLVNLANTIVDGGGAVRVAKVNVAARQKMPQRDLNLETAEANLQTSVKRLELLKGIASIALEGASAEFERTNERYHQGVQVQQEVSEA